MGVRVHVWRRAGTWPRPGTVSSLELQRPRPSHVDLRQGVLLTRTTGRDWGTLRSGWWVGHCRSARPEEEESSASFACAPPRPWGGATGSLGYREDPSRHRVHCATVEMSAPVGSPRSEERVSCRRSRGAASRRVATAPRTLTPQPSAGVPPWGQPAVNQSPPSEPAWGQQPVPPPPAISPPRAQAAWDPQAAWEQQQAAQRQAPPQQWSQQQVAPQQWNQQQSAPPPVIPPPVVPQQWSQQPVRLPFSTRR